jgi:hypothetical protein
MKRNMVNLNEAPTPLLKPDTIKFVLARPPTPPNMEAPVRPTTNNQLFKFNAELLQENLINSGLAGQIEE